MELEQNRSLPFMDVRFTRLPSGALEREVYRKLTHTNRYIHADSHQPMNVKSATIRCLVDRAFKEVFATLGVKLRMSTANHPPN